MDGIVRARARIRGRVQGVWFRASTRTEAESLGLTGWVRNLDSGDVEAVFEGTDQAVRAALEWCETGPEHASVSSVDVGWEQPEGLEGFTIR